MELRLDGRESSVLLSGRPDTELARLEVRLKGRPTSAWLDGRSGRADKEADMDVLLDGRPISDGRPFSVRLAGRSGRTKSEVLVLVRLLGLLLPGTGPKERRLIPDVDILDTCFGITGVSSPAVEALLLAILPPVVLFLLLMATLEGRKL